MAWAEPESGMCSKIANERPSWDTALSQAAFAAAEAEDEVSKRVVNYDD